MNYLFSTPSQNMSSPQLRSGEGVRVFKGRYGEKREKRKWDK
jgi:hypothetical protein